MAVTVRTLGSAAELAESDAVFHTSMVGLPLPAPDEPIRQLREPGRTFGAVTDEGALVGTVDATSGAMTVPGGAVVPHAGVTHVGVLPTHTRRGVLTALMRHQLDDCAARGDVVASLRASEAVIYGRYGYGIAGSTQSVELDLRAAVLRPGAEGDSAGVRLAAPEQAWDAMRRIVETRPATRPGSISRPPEWWAGRRVRPRTGPGYVALYGPPGGETAYASYRPLDTHTWFTSRDRTVVVDDLHAPDPAGYRALVSFLMRLDLVHTVRFPWAPLDSPLPWMLTDHRAARVTGVADETWLRLVDVPAALSARTYAAGDPVAVRVRDALLPRNTGVYRITADGAGRDDAAEPEVNVDVADLAAVYLGGTRWHQLAAAGRAEVLRDGAIARLDALCTAPQAPFAGVMF